MIDIEQPGLEGDVPDYSRGLEQEKKKALTDGWKTGNSIQVLPLSTQKDNAT